MCYTFKLLLLTLALPLRFSRSQSSDPPNILTNITCQPGFEWASNSAQQSPCAVAAAASFACSASCASLHHLLTPFQNWVSLQCQYLLRLWFLASITTPQVWMASLWIYVAGKCLQLFFDRHCLVKSPKARGWHTTCGVRVLYAREIVTESRLSLITVRTVPQNWEKTP